MLKNFHESLQFRYATKLFDSSKKVSEETFAEITECLRLAPSSYGLQPWKFLIIQNPEIRQKIREKSWNQSQVTDASHLIVLCSNTEFTADDVNHYADFIVSERNIPREAIEGYRQMMLGSLHSKSPEATREWMARQVYLALGVLLSACAEARLDACPMEGFDPEAVGEILGLPAKKLAARVLCPIGYRSTEDKLASMKKVRFSKEEVFEVV
jgi:nitroreductase / dihydropteridine reductase